MGELGQELGLLVVLEVNVVFGKVYFEPCKRGRRTNLNCNRSVTVSRSAIGCTHALALGLLWDRVKRAERHF